MNSAKPIVSTTVVLSQNDIDTDQIIPARFLTTTSREGLGQHAFADWRYGADGVTDEIRQRLDRELEILADKRISTYFLIVWDFVNEARRRGIPAGARGPDLGFRCAR